MKPLVPKHMQIAAGFHMFVTSRPASRLLEPHFSTLPAHRITQVAVRTLMEKVHPPLIKPDTSILFYFIFVTFYVEIIRDVHAVARGCTERSLVPSTQVSPHGHLFT